MEYNGFYYRLFRGSMKKVIASHHGEEFARSVMKKSDKLYKKMVLEAPEMGKGNPMAYNALFGIAFAAPYLASEKKIPPEEVAECMKAGLYHVKWFFSRTDLNTAKGKDENKKNIVKYVKWYTPDKQKAYPESFKVDFEGQPYEGACYYRITRCPINTYFRRLDIAELMPLFCELDSVMISLQHGVLHRSQSIAAGGSMCDYFITGDKEKV